MASRVVYLGRQPPAKDMVGKAMSALGGMLRSAGEALDNIGAAVQGKASNTETLTPNVAWMPVINDGQTTSSAHVREVPAKPSVADSSKINIVTPVKAADVFVAPNANIMGHVKLGKGSSVWYGAVLRGDVNKIEVGSHSNIQDNVIIHVARNTADGQPSPTIIGNNCTVGHSATVHACTIGDNCMVGMGATVLDHAKLEPGSLVAAGATVTPGTVVPSGQIWAGSPAKFLRNLTAEEQGFIKQSAENYAALAAEHATECGKSFEDLLLDGTIREERSYREGTKIDAHKGIHRDPDTQAILSVHP